MAKKQDESKIKRSALTGRIVNGRDVILTSEVEDYLKKNGYIIIDKEKKAINIGVVIDMLRNQGFKILTPKMIAGIETLTTVFLVYGSFFAFGII